jgi:hypothetical protein
MKLGINNAIKILHQTLFSDVFDNRYAGLKTINEIEDYDYEWLLNYIANLELPYDVVEKFFNSEINFTDLNGNPTGDDWDYLVIDNDGEIFCWTEVLGNIYYIKDYGTKWIDDRSE